MNKQNEQRIRNSRFASPIPSTDRGSLNEGAFISGLEDKQCDRSSPLTAIGWTCGGKSCLVSGILLEELFQELFAKQAREMEQIHNQYRELTATDEQRALAEYLSSMTA